MFLETEYLEEKEARTYLKALTGCDYVFAQGAHRKWGGDEMEVTQNADGKPYFQIMPYSFDDGFFDWYVVERKHRQFFESRETCIIHFLYFREIWRKKQKV